MVKEDWKYVAIIDDKSGHQKLGFFAYNDLNSIINCKLTKHPFYTPLVWWCPFVRVSVRPSMRPSQFSALFSYMLWDIVLKFCVSLYFYARKIKFECHQFPSIFARVMPLLNFKPLQICSFPHFFPTCFDILS